MSISFLSAVFECRAFTPHEKLVMLALADHADEAGRCFPSIARLALRTGMSGRGVQKVLRRLEERGFLRTDMNGGRGGANAFRLHFTAAEPCITPEARSPLNQVHPELQRRTPRTRFTSTPEPRSPEPSLNHQEPCARERRKGAEPSDKHNAGAEKTQGNDQDAKVKLARFFAEKIALGAYVPPSSIKPDLARRMLAHRMVEPDALRQAGIRW